MKKIFITLIVTLLCIYSNAQLVYLKGRSINSAPIYSSPRLNSKVIGRVGIPIVFQGESFQGNWTKIIDENGAVIGFIENRKSQYFDDLPLEERKVLFKAYFSEFYLLLNNPNGLKTRCADRFQFFKFRVGKQFCYNYIYYPLIESYFKYDQSKFDKKNLLVLFDISKISDGELAQTLSVLFLTSYINHSVEFHRLINNFVDKKEKEDFRDYLQSCIVNYYKKVYGVKKQDSQIDKEINQLLIVIKEN